MVAILGRRAQRASMTAALTLIVAGCAAGSRTYDGVAVSARPVAPGSSRTASLRRSARAVGVIETDIGRGLGFVVDPSGYILTNRHVVEDADHIETMTFPQLDPPRTFESVEIEYIDPVRDLALLRVHADEPLPRMPLAASRQAPIHRYARIADPVALLEPSEGQSGALRLHNGEIATVSARNPAAGPGAFIGVSVDVDKGQSGGPVLDSRGRAVGVVTWTWKDKAGGFAIPISDATEMLAERPRLGSASEKADRAAVRTREFLAALGRGDVEDARRLTSPSHARAVREASCDQILAGVQQESGMVVLQGFVGAVESLVDLTDDDERFEKLRHIVSRTGAPEFRAALGLDAEVDSGQVVSFFYELGQAYLAARVIGDEDPNAAFQTALRRLRTIDAARTFALADALHELAGNEVVIEKIDVVPGVYNPRAVVSLLARSGGRVHSGDLPHRYAVQTRLEDGTHLTLHMRLEWGDWYVAAIGPTPLGDRRG